MNAEASVPDPYAVFDAALERAHWKAERVLGSHEIRPERLSERLAAEHIAMLGWQGALRWQFLGSRRPGANRAWAVRRRRLRWLLLLALWMPGLLLVLGRSFVSLPLESVVEAWNIASLLRALGGVGFLALLVTLLGALVGILIALLQRREAAELQELTKALAVLSAPDAAAPSSPRSDASRGH